MIIIYCYLEIIDDKVLKVYMNNFRFINRRALTFQKYISTSGAYKKKCGTHCWLTNNWQLLKTSVDVKNKKFSWS